MPNYLLERAEQKNARVAVMISDSKGKIESALW
jgi:hypothetical protein